jgi:hypothetical protein
MAAIHEREDGALRHVRDPEGNVVSFVQYRRAPQAEEEDQ